MKTLQVLPLFPPEQAEKPEAFDNVFLREEYTWPVYNLQSAINNCKEVNHPTLYDNPRAVIKSYFELDLRTKKKVCMVNTLLIGHLQMYALLLLKVHNKKTF